MSFLYIPSKSYLALPYRYICHKFWYTNHNRCHI